MHAPSDARSLEQAALYLALLAVPGIGTSRALGQLATWGSVKSIAEADHPLGHALRSRLGTARATIAAALDAGVSVVPLEHRSYPPALKEGEVKGPPLVLFVEGTLPPVLAAEAGVLRSCALVGTRRATRFSLELAHDIAAALAREGVLVVSGLALGVDGAAHEGALAGAAHATPAAPATVAVLGGGHRHLHPPQHHDLARRIVEQGGAVVSEWPPDSRPARHNFLRRNRVISALAACVVVIEAGSRSGALNTASHALEQGRAVLAVPGRPNDPRYAGTLRLLHEGAAMVLDASDVLAQFGVYTQEPTPRGSRAGGAQRVPWTSPLPDHRDGGHEAVVRRLLSRTDEASLDVIVSAVTTGEGGSGNVPTPGPRHAQADAADTAAALTALLTVMELSGEIERTETGRYRLRTARR